MATLKGSCACGAVQWEVSGAPIFSGYCHCSYCRSNHGSDMVHQAGFPAPAVKFLQGEDNVTRFSFKKDGPGAAPVRTSCKTCGSKTHNIIMGGNAYGFPVTTFCNGPAVNGAPTKMPEILKAAVHVHYASRLSDVNDSLPKFLDMPQPFGGTGQMHEAK